jgi:arsenical pump membrane protein
MYLVVYGLRNAGLTDALSGVLNVLAENGLWVATLGTGVLTAVLSSLMNNMPTVLVGALSIDGSTATGVIKEAMIYANVIGCDLGPKSRPSAALRRCSGCMFWRKRTEPSPGATISVPGSS